MTVAYMHLVFARERFWEVSVGDESFRTNAKTSAQALQDHYAQQVLPSIVPAAEAALAQWDQELSDLRSATSRRSETRKRGSMGSRVAYQVEILTFPDGEVAECPGSGSVDALIDALIRDKMTANNGPRPSVPASGDYRAWQSEVSATASEVRGWTGYSYEPDGSVQVLEADFSNWAFGLPLSGITVVLNRYAADGWSLVSSSEDKGLYTGEDAGSEAFPARVRFLLSR